MAVKVANNAFATLAGSITPSQTTITLASGQGARFPVLQPGDWFWGTLNNAANNIEIVKVTTTAADTFTVARAQDGTTGLAWNAGDKFELRTPAALFGNYMDQATFNTWFVGVITMWSGAIGSIPAHWHICDGTNGTPDLRDRFIVGAGNSYAVAATGGNTTNTLTVSQLPSHGHGVTDPSHAHGVYDPGHVHGITDPTHAHTLNDPGHAHSVYDPGHGHGVSDPGHGHGVNDPGHVHGIESFNANFSLNNIAGQLPRAGNGGVAINTDSSGTGISIQGAGSNISINGAGSNIGIYGSGTGLSMNAHATGVSVNAAETTIGIYGNTTGIAIQNTGSGATVENRPPYYALAYIMYTG